MTDYQDVIDAAVALLATPIVAAVVGAAGAVGAFVAISKGVKRLFR